MPISTKVAVYLETKVRKKTAVENMGWQRNYGDTKFEQTMVP